MGPDLTVGCSLLAPDSMSTSSKFFHISLLCEIQKPGTLSVILLVIPSSCFCPAPSLFAVLFESLIRSWAIGDQDGLSPISLISMVYCARSGTHTGVCSKLLGSEHDVEEKVGEEGFRGSPMGTWLSLTFWNSVLGEIHGFAIWLCLILVDHQLPSSCILPGKLRSFGFTEKNVYAWDLAPSFIYLLPLPWHSMSFWMNAWADGGRWRCYFCFQLEVVGHIFWDHVSTSMVALCACFLGRVYLGLLSQLHLAEPLGHPLCTLSFAVVWPWGKEDNCGWEQPRWPSLPDS